MAKIYTTNYSHQIFEGFDAGNQEDWIRIVPPDDLAMDPRLISVIQRTLGAQFKFWNVVIYDDRKIPVACAALCLFRIDGLEAAPKFIRNFSAAVRHIWPGFMKFGVLFCGLPIPPAQSSLRFASNADRAACVRIIHNVMLQLERRQGAMLTVFKELNETQEQQLGVLPELGYIRGDIPPMHHFTKRFNNFEDYLNNLKARYRSQIQRSIRKFEQAGFTARRVTQAHAIIQIYTDQLHTLYEQVWSKSKYRLEKLPVEFFRELARAYPDDVSITLLERQGRVAAFTFSLAVGSVYHNMYSGMDYELNAQGDLYFNLFYNDLDGAFQAGCADIELGQTSDEFKARLGSAPQSICFFTKARNPVIHRILQKFSHRLFPAVPKVELHNVYKEEPPKKTSSKKKGSQREIREGDAKECEETAL